MNDGSDQNQSLVETVHGVEKIPGSLAGLNEQITELVTEKIHELA